MFQAPLQTLSWFEIPLHDLERVERLHWALRDDACGGANGANGAQAAEQFTDLDGRSLGWLALQ